MTSKWFNRTPYWEYLGMWKEDWRKV